MRTHFPLPQTPPPSVVGKNSVEESTISPADVSTLATGIKELQSMLKVVVGGPSNSRPFFADGEFVSYVGVDELARHIPRSPDTLIEWAKRGVIPGLFVPGKTAGKVGKKGSWLFELTSVKRALDKYRVA